MMIVLEELGALIHLLIATFLAIIYAKYRATVILPAVMFASLVGVLLHLEVHPFILGISDFAAALIVFVAGLELDPKFIRKEKERVLIMIIVEALLFLTLFYVLTSFLPFPIAVTIAAIVVASNEAFALEVGRLYGGELGQYGITLSVFEDALAVFLLSVGLFTTAKVALTSQELGLMLSIVISLIPLLYLISGPFDRFIDSIERVDTKILLSILYLTLLIAIAEVVKLPEALVVFIGSVMMSLRGFDREAFKAIESYFQLALIGFVASLPFTVSSPHGGSPMNLDVFLMAMLEGLGLAVAAFIIRSFFVFVSSVMSGLSVRDSLSLALCLANTGEFGLIVLAYLIKTTGIIPAELAYAAMFAYAFNLTLVSYIVNNIDKAISLYMRLLGQRLINALEMVSAEANSFINATATDVEFKRGLLQLSIVLTLVYVIIGIERFAHHVVLEYVFSILVFSAFILSIQEVFKRFSEDIGRLISPKSAFAVVFRFIIIYVVVAPLLHFLSAEFNREYMLLPLDSPISLLLVLLATYGLAFIVRKISSIIVSVEEAEPSEEG